MDLNKYLKLRCQGTRQFAEILDVSYETVRRYRTGERRPGWNVLALIAVVTEGAVTANDFVPPIPGAIGQRETAA